ncbi:MAG: 16S rRNA (guanine(966)-N(2))-methyltransferase RsmD [Desulfovibrionaceae bacterium]|nr:16S rRNA (guanine(966)-N(2))-methyltransferase RsmD [Desulfovibrionaceae bacterium]
MRIVSGTLGSRRLRTVEGEGYRPAMGRVREALFSILSHRLHWQGCQVIDLFAGSGSLAFEALSRGAEKAWLVELSPKACRCIRENISDLGLEGRAFLVQEDVLKLLRRVKGADRNVGGPFDVVFLDPPYRKHLTQSSLDALCQCGWLTPGAFVCVEVEEGLSLTLPEGLSLVTQRNFGQTNTLVCRMDGGSEDLP